MSEQAQTVSLRDVAKIIRSKNAGPFQLTIDIFFRREEDYALTKADHTLTAELVARRYHIPISDVVGIYYWDAAMAIKVTLVRGVSAGAPGDNDCYGAQQHAPLLDIPVPAAGAHRHPLQHVQVQRL
jgi:hypothetical protein